MKRMKRTVAASLFALVVSAAVFAKAPANRLPVPDDAAQREASKLIADVFKPQYEAAKTPEQKVKLAQHLLQTGIETADDPAARYALFRIARDVASSAGDVETAFEASDQIARYYEAEAMELKLATITKIAKNSRLANDHKALFPYFDLIILEAIAKDRYDVVKAANDLALASARQTRDVELIKRATVMAERLVRLEAEFGKVKEARALLDREPMDPAANLAVGKFYCFVKNDWETGLPLLALGGEETLKSLAAMELHPERQDPVEIGDGWWEVAKKYQGQEAEAIKVHAAFWYRNAKDLAGLVKVRVERRLAEAPADANVRRLHNPLPERARPLVAPFTGQEARDAQAAWARQLGRRAVEKNTAGIDLVLIPPGSFKMGSPANERERHESEEQVEVTLTKPYFLSKTEITQRQWEAVMETRPWQGQRNVKEDANCAATYISWEDAMEFCRKLTESERRAGQLPNDWEYTLPTEAQWEYACRAGTTTRFYFGDDAFSLVDYAWLARNARRDKEGHAREVGQKLANAFGLHDMHGNVSEWCLDQYQMKLPGGTDPLGTTSPKSLSRLSRGGSWFTSDGSLRSAWRGGGFSMKERRHTAGFRLTLVPAGQ